VTQYRKERLRGGGSLLTGWKGDVRIQKRPSWGRDSLEKHSKKGKKSVFTGKTYDGRTWGRREGDAGPPLSRRGWERKKKKS